MTINVRIFYYHADVTAVTGTSDTESAAESEGLLYYVS
jgi:hypothetical protein